MKITKYPLKADWNVLLERPAVEAASLEETVKTVFGEVGKDGDLALKAYTSKFDQVDLKELLVTPQEIQAAIKEVDPGLKSAIETAKRNIETFHRQQAEPTKVIETMPGVTCWRKSVPIQKVGLYIPGGTAPLFSTVLMLGIPAQLAGCQEIVLCSPPNKEGNIHPAILFTANLVGVKKIYKLGGIQAIAAMSIGTESVPAVYKIFGPGNQYVTAAKQYAQQSGLAIDMPAGPSEVMVIADATANPAFVAADLLSQAEHGADSQVVMLSTDEKILNETKSAVEQQLGLLPRKEVAAQALQNSKLILLKDAAEVMDMCNAYAPEHLILAVAQPEMLADQVQNAGSVFMGHLTPESAGDYASGTNHTLPTNGYARAYSGVSLDSFVKKITFQKISENGLLALGPVVETMAEAEQLVAHKNAVTLRLNHIKAKS